jgi:hypothetical protein
MPENFRAELCKGFDCRRAAQVLSQKGILIPGDSGSFTRRPTPEIPGYGRKRVYILRIPAEHDDEA